MTNCLKQRRSVQTPKEECTVNKDDQHEYRRRSASYEMNCPFMICARTQNVLHLAWVYWVFVYIT